jgi:hypothetical protein
MRYDALALVILIVIALYVYHRRNRIATKKERAVMFNECLSLFDSYKMTQDGNYYPILNGRYRGYRVTLEPIADHAGFRTLPSLWLLTSIRGSTPFGGIFDYLRRPKNVEFYSPSWQLDRDIVIPDGWPKDAWLRTDNPDQMPPQHIIEPHMNLFDDLKAKELLVTPKGVRIVYQAKEAIRSYYMLLRQVKFEDTNLSPAMVKELLDRAIALYDDLNRGHPQIGKKSEKKAIGG